MNKTEREMQVAVHEARTSEAEVAVDAAQQHEVVVVAVAVWRVEPEDVGVEHNVWRTVDGDADSTTKV